MSDLRDPLDDLLADIPAYVVPDARAAWAAGARRRTRHRIAVVACAAVVIALAAGLATWLPRTVGPQPADGDSVGGYPARVVKPWRSADLPRTPGPMALVYQRNSDDLFGWWVADENGRTWPVPQQGLMDNYPPALSPDGRMLGYATQRSYGIRDLATGMENGLSLDQSRDAPWVLTEQSPAFWSPDSQHLLLRVGGGAEAVVVDAEFNMQKELESPGFPAGWVDEDTVAFVVNGSAENGVAPLELRLIGLDGKVEREVRLQVSRNDAAWVDQHGVSIDPTGERVVVQNDRDVLVFSTVDGSRLDTTANATGTCTPSWQEGVPVVVRTGTLVQVSGEVVTDFDERLGVGCVAAASGALAGERHVGLAQRWFGDGWLAFNLPLAVTFAVGAVAVLAVALLVIRIRRRRAHRLG